MRTQDYTMNPEKKYIAISDNLSGGVNLMYSDDQTSDSEFRQLINFNLENRGSLDKRKGFTENNALSEVLFYEGVTEETFPMFYSTKENSFSDIVLFKLLENTDGIFSLLSNAVSLESFIKTLRKEYILKLFIVANPTNLFNNSVVFINTYTISNTGVVRNSKKVPIEVRFNVENNLMDIDYGESTRELFLTYNEKGLVIFNKQDETFSYIINNDEILENVAYKPSALDVRKKGFNVLGDDPLSWINNNNLTTPSIQGIYLTTTDRIPITNIPTNYKFQVNIMYTGTKDNFTIVLKDFSKIESQDEQSGVLSIDSVKSEELSKEGLAVYDITIKVPPSTETELSVKMDDETTISTYYDYFSVASVDPEAQVIVPLNVGNYKTIDIGQRLVYYYKDTIWFSDINQFDYVPNYNYVFLQLRDTDEIVKIVYFRNNYIIFTREEIWKIESYFGSDDFAVSSVNDSVGCVSPNSIRRIGENLYFLSQTGFRQLSNDKFIEGLENVKTFDEKVKDYVYSSSNAYSLYYNNQYVLFYNLREERPKINLNYQSFDVPDVLRYYPDLKAFVFDQYPIVEDKKIYPYFIMDISGEMFSFLDNKIYKYGDDYSDFGYPLKCVIETAGNNFGYPDNIKKLKEFVIKAIGGESIQPLYIRAFGDGTIVHDFISFDVEIDSQRQVIYTENRTPTTNLRPIVNILGESKLGQTVLGYSPIILVKLKVPSSKAKNFAFYLETETKERFTLMSIGYTIKFGKVKE